MIVVIEEAVFSAQSTEPLTLLGLFNLGFRGKHRIQTNPLWNPESDQAVNRWLEQQHRSVTDQVKHVLTAGLESDVLDVPSDLTVCIANCQKPDWDAMRLTPDDALDFLQRPLHLLVENKQNDGAFLRMVAPEPWRGRLLDAISKHHVEIEHGGGSGMKERVLEASCFPEDALRLWVLFDSDAREPGQSSEGSIQLSHSCRQAQVTYHCLKRRESENYIPLSALEAWVNLSPTNKRPTRRRTFRAFASMSPDQRHHYNVRDGFLSDRKSGIPPFYDDWAEHRDLQQGFGNDVRSIFHQKGFMVLERWMVKDGQREETLSMIQSIFRRL